MSPRPTPITDLEHTCSQLLGESVVRVQHLSTLWGGYGDIYRLYLESGVTRILKLLSPPPVRQNESHLRKMLSYQVERNFYQNHTHSVIECAVPKYFGSKSNTSTSYLIIDDLARCYPIFTEMRESLDQLQSYRAIEWLARFHTSSWDIENKIKDSHNWCPSPKQAYQQNWKGETGLWQQGGYIYLSTRTDELERIPQNSHWVLLGLHSSSQLPKAVDWCLYNPLDRSRLSLIHGDVKAANMAFSNAGEMAMYDFQYVGKGLGVMDLVKLLATSVPEQLLQQDGEAKLLNHYRICLLQYHPTIQYSQDDFDFDWQLAMVNWVRFLAGWSGGFWGNVEWLQSRAIRILKNTDWKQHVIDRYEGQSTLSCTHVV